MQWAALILEARTARASGVSVSDLRGHGWGWTPPDRLLAMALLVHEDSICRGCGQYVDEAYDVRAVGEYEVRSQVCEGCAARERHQDRSKDDRHVHGELTYVVDLRREED